MDSIVVEHLGKRFGQTVAVDDVSFSVPPGELFGFLGPNGAGKSTTISMLCTLLRPTAGSARINGFDVARQRSQVRAAIGLVFQDPSLDDRLTAWENLAFHARVYNLPHALWHERSAQLLHMVDLWERRDHLVRTFSGGMKRRLEIARGLLHHPSVLFLDEPTIGLDPQTREHIWGYMGQMREREGVTLFLTTHYMDEAAQCERIGIVDHGHLVALDTPERLKARVGGDVVLLEVADRALASARLRERLGLQATPADGHLRLEVADAEHVIPHLFAELGAAITGLTVRRPTLDDVFLALTGRALRDEEASGGDQLRARAQAMRR